MNVDTIKCEDCGHRSPATTSTCVACGAALSDPSDSVDTLDPRDIEAVEDDLVARASVPNLAALFGQAKKAGLIKPVQDYGNPA